MEEHALEDYIDELDPPYESKEEAQIGHMLDEYDIPFFYKHATIVYDQGQNKLEYPAFTIPAYGGVVIDYMRSSYGDRYKYKQEMYEQNQIPAVVITQEDLQGSTWQQQLYQKLNSTYNQMPSYQQPSGYIQPG